MGYYIEVPKNKGKAQQIVELFGARIIPYPPAFGEVKPHEAIICVVDNGLFEAAGLVYNAEELAEFKAPDGRPRIWLLIDKVKAWKLTGYTGSA